MIKKATRFQVAFLLFNSLFSEKIAVYCLFGLSL